MKKFVSLMMVAVLALTMLAGCGGKKAEATTPAGNVPASALEILETVWADYADDEKFAVIGGSMANPVDGAPGSYDIADENISFNLLIPAEQVENITEAASMIHMMNANSFTCGVFRMAEGASAEDFAATMKEAVQGNMWMCGFPETLLIQIIGGEYVLVAFGVNDAMDPFMTHLSAVYPDAQTVVNEPIA